MPTDYRPDTGSRLSAQDHQEWGQLLLASQDLDIDLAPGADPGRAYLVLAQALTSLRHYAHAAGIDYLAADAQAATWFAAEPETTSPIPEPAVTAACYRAYLSRFERPALALLDLATRAGIAVAYLDRTAIEASRGAPLSDEQWDDVAYGLHWYDEHVSGIGGGDSNLAFLEQVFTRAGVPFGPEEDSIATQS